MADYHVGAGLFGIYAGTLNPKGDTWRNEKSAIREVVIDCSQLNERGRFAGSTAPLMKMAGCVVVNVR
jgi:hypothetical protein